MMMPPAKRLRKDETLDSSFASGDLESSTSSESVELENSQLDPELEADMEQYRKPDCSYIELIAKAIMESPEKKLRLQDIYDTLEKKHPYFQVADPGWRNSIRHNLSLHECFCKTERCGSGKGHFWSIHPIHMQDFLAGDFRRKTVKSRARQLHEQQRQLQQCAVGGAPAAALASPTITSPSPSIMSPLGQTHFHFPSPFKINNSPERSHSTVPASPILPSSPSLMYSPTGGVFFGSFPFTFVCGGAYPLFPLPLSPPKTDTNGSSYPFSLPPLASNLPRSTTSYPPISSITTTPAGAEPYSLSSLSVAPSTTVTASHLPIATSINPLTSLSVPTRPPVLPPVCCINSPPVPIPDRSGTSGTGTLTGAMSLSHTPHFAYHSTTMQDNIRATTFSIEDILAL